MTSLSRPTGRTEEFEVSNPPTNKPPTPTVSAVCAEKLEKLWSDYCRPHLDKAEQLITEKYGVLESKIPWVNNVCVLLNQIRPENIGNIMTGIFELANPSAYGTTYGEIIGRTLLGMTTPTLNLLEANHDLVTNLNVVVKAFFAVKEDEVAVSHIKLVKESEGSPLLGETPGWAVALVAVVTSLLTAIVGLTGCFSIPSMKKTITEFGNYCRSLNNIKMLFKDGVGIFVKFLSDILSSLFGYKLMTEKELGHQEKLEQLKAIQAELRETVKVFSSDPFALLDDLDHLERLKDQVTRAETILASLGTESASFLNARPLIDIIRDDYKQVYDYMKDLLCEDGLKVAPAVVTLCGPPGLGKTRAINNLVSELTKLHGRYLSVYTRSPSDPFMSKYNPSLKIFVHDDFNQMTSNVDHGELMSAATGISWFTNKAAVDEKGTPYGSIYHMLTMNAEYVVSSSTTSDLDALNGRRGLVYAFENDFIVKHFNGQRPSDIDFQDEKIASQAQEAVRFRKIPAIPVSRSGDSHEQGVMRGRVLEYFEDEHGISSHGVGSYETCEEIARQLYKMHLVNVKVYKERKLAKLEQKKNTLPKTIAEITTNNQTIAQHQAARNDKVFELLDELASVSTDAESHGASNVRSPEVKAVLIAGPPGTGKSYLVATHLGNYSIKHIWKRSDDVQLTSFVSDIVVLDDITTSSAFFQVANEFLQLYYDGAFPNVKRVVVTLNNHRICDVLPPESADQTREMLYRRCHVFTTSFKRDWKYELYTYQTAEAYLKKPGSRISKCVQLVKDRATVSFEMLNKLIAQETVQIPSAVVWNTVPNFVHHEPDFILACTHPIPDIISILSDLSVTGIAVWMGGNVSVVHGEKVGALSVLGELAKKIYDRRLYLEERGVTCDDFALLLRAVMDARVPWSKVVVLHSHGIVLTACPDDTGLLAFGIAGALPEAMKDRSFDPITVKAYNRIVGARRVVDGSEHVEQVISRVQDEICSAAIKVTRPLWWVLGKYVAMSCAAVFGCWLATRRNTRLLLARDKAELFDEYCEDADYFEFHQRTANETGDTKREDRDVKAVSRRLTRHQRTANETGDTKREDRDVKAVSRRLQRHQRTANETGDTKREDRDVKAVSRRLQRHQRSANETGDTLQEDRDKKAVSRRLQKHSLGEVKTKKGVVYLCGDASTTEDDFEVESDEELEEEDSEIPQSCSKTTADLQQAGLDIKVYGLGPRETVSKDRLKLQLTASSESAQHPNRRTYAFGRGYSYDRKELISNPMSGYIDELRVRLNNRFNTEYNFCLVNVYDKCMNGKTGIGMHKDNEESLDKHHPIGSMQCGEEKKITLTKGGKTVFRLPLDNDTYVHYGPTVQDQFRHGITPYVPDKKNPRISLTFRKVLEEEEEAHSFQSSFLEKGTRRYQVAQNQYPLCDEEGHELAHVVMIEGRRGVFCTHCTRTKKLYVKDKTNKLHLVSWKRMGKHRPDVCVLELDRKFSEVPSIRKLVMTENDTDSYAGKKAIIISGDENRHKIIATSLIEHGHATTASGDLVRGFRCSSVLDKYSSHSASEPGDSGSSYLLTSPSIQHPLLGIHSAGTSTTAWCSIFTIEDFDYAFETPMEHTAGVYIQRTDEVLPVTETGKDISDMLGHGCRVVGEMPHRPMDQCKTQITRSPFNVDMSDQLPDITDQYEPVVFQNNDPRLPEDYEGHVEIDAALKWVDSQPDDPISEAEVIELIEECSEYVNGLIRKHGPPPRCRVATLLEAINGIKSDDFPHSNRMNMKTSAGAPYIYTTTTGKKAFFEWDEKKEIYRPAKTGLGKRLVDDISNLARNCKARRKTAAIFISRQKDEVKKKKHIFETPKTRAFAAGPLHLNLLWKKYFMYAGECINNLNGKKGSPFTNGMAPHSEEYDAMIREMLSIGPRGIDEDVADWDAKFFDLYMKHMWRFYDNIYKEFGTWCEGDSSMREGIYKHMFEPLIAVKGYIIQCHGGPSGKLATRSDNDFAQLIEKLRVWKRFVRQMKGQEQCSELLAEAIEANPPNRFLLRDLNESIYCMMEFTCPKMGGDDHVNTISPRIEPYYHFNTIKDMFKNVLDKDITDAQKSSVGYTTRPLSDLEFLKRKPVMIGGFWRGQLLKDSLDKTINWGQCKMKRMPWEIRDSEIVITHDYESQIHDILMESAVHGRDFFDRMQKHLQICMENIGSTAGVPSYSQVSSYFWAPL